MEEPAKRPRGPWTVPGEIQFRPAWRSFAVFWIAAALFALGPLANPEAVVKPSLGLPIAAACVVFAVIKRLTTRYRVSESGVESFSTLPGLRDHRAVALAEVTRVDVRRGIIHRLLNIAHVHLHTESAGGVAVKMFGVTYPQEFKAMLLARGADDDNAVGMWR